MQAEEEGKQVLKVDVWFGKRATLAAIRTLCSHVQNMISAPPITRTAPKNSSARPGPGSPHRS